MLAFSLGCQAWRGLNPLVLALHEHSIWTETRLISRSLARLSGATVVDLQLVGRIGVEGRLLLNLQGLAQPVVGINWPDQSNKGLTARRTAVTQKPGGEESLACSARISQRRVVQGRRCKVWEIEKKKAEIGLYRREEKMGRGEALAGYHKSGRRRFKKWFTKRFTMWFTDDP